MTKLYGKNFTKRELLQRIGSVSQIGGLKNYILNDGRAKGVAAVDVKTGSGLEYTVLPDRGMDMAWASFKGIPFSFVSKTNIVSPYFFNIKDGFMRGFYAGLLTTCGIRNSGAPCVDNGEELGAHGRANNLPAENLSISQEWIDDELVMTMKGSIREVKFFAENMVLNRTLTSTLGLNKIIIKDIVENEGFSVSPLMLLYHFNFGYPFIDKGTEIRFLNEAETQARDSEAEKGIETFNVMHESEYEYKEQVFNHKLKPDKEGNAAVEIVNHNLGFKVKISYRPDELPYLIQWKQMGEGDYALGLEPSTWKTRGRAEARKQGELLCLEPGQKKIINLELAVEEI